MGVWRVGWLAGLECDGRSLRQLTPRGTPFRATCPLAEGEAGREWHLGRSRLVRSADEYKRGGRGGRFVTITARVTPSRLVLHAAGRTPQPPLLAPFDLVAPPLPYHLSIAFPTLFHDPTHPC